jgi:Raf kinase inhibitor-like YbhB/YbcL family protein
VRQNVSGGAWNIAAAAVLLLQARHHARADMKLTSASFLADRPIPEQFAFGAPDPVLHIRLAANHNPHLKWSGAPAGTRSFAVICVDPDVPGKSDDVNKEGRVVPASLRRVNFYHWVMVDIPATTSELAAGGCSDGIVAGGKKELQGPPGSRQGVNDYTGWFAEDPDMSGTYRGYDGPCPPWNDMRVHHYHFTVYALSCERCSVDGDFTGPQVLDAIHRFVLAEATLTGTYTLNSAATAR